MMPGLRQQPDDNRSQSGLPLGVEADQPIVDTTVQQKVNNGTHHRFKPLTLALSQDWDIGKLTVSRKAFAENIAALETKVWVSLRLQTTVLDEVSFRHHQLLLR
jgi:hypothetical protein